MTGPRLYRTRACNTHVRRCLDRRKQSPILECVTCYPYLSVHTTLSDYVAKSYINFLKKSFLFSVYYSCFIRSFTLTTEHVNFITINSGP